MNTTTEIDCSVKTTDKGEEEFLEDNIDDILEKISLNPPKSPFVLFCAVEAQKMKKDKKNFSFSEKAKIFSKVWANLDQKEKEKYHNLFSEEKKIYKKNIEIVRHFLFKDYNDIIRRPPTAFRIFLNEKMIEGF